MSVPTIFTNDYTLFNFFDDMETEQQLIGLFPADFKPKSSFNIVLQSGVYDSSAQCCYNYSKEIQCVAQQVYDVVDSGSFFTNVRESVLNHPDISEQIFIHPMVHLPSLVKSALESYYINAQDDKSIGPKLQLQHDTKGINIQTAFSLVCFEVTYIPKESDETQQYDNQSDRDDHDYIYGDDEENNFGEDYECDY